MNKTLPIVEVVAGAIVDPRGFVLVALRPQHQHQGGLWEFPGGKINHGETSTEALVRELQEELDIVVLRARQMLMVQHQYVDKIIHLDMHWVDEFEGIPQGREGQTIRWVRSQELSELTFPAANQKVIQRVQQRLLEIE